MSRPGRQRGAALVLALSVVAVAAVLAMTMLERGRSGMARTTALADGERAWQLAGGMETLAREWLADARQGGIDETRLAGRWSEPFPVPGGMVRGRLLDRSGPFNVNALADPDPAAAAAGRRALEQLLAHLGVGRAAAEDWIATVVRRLRPTDGTAVLLAHPAEMFQRPGDDGLVERVGAHVTVLPDPAARININTTTPEVLAAWTPGLARAGARRVLADRPYADLAQVLAHPALANVDGGVLEQRFAVTSHWYLAHARVRLGGVDRDFYRLMRTGGGGYDFRYFSQGVP